MRRENGFFVDNDPPPIPEHWTRVDLGQLDYGEMVRVCDWILEIDVLDRGIRHEGNKTVESGLALLDSLGPQAHRMLWEHARKGFDEFSRKGGPLDGMYQAGFLSGKPTYPGVFWFATDADAVAFRIVMVGHGIG